MTINDYQFGEIIANGKKYQEADIIIFPDRASLWRCADHHHPILADFQNVLAAKPDILIIGTGFWGVMRIAEKIQEILEKKIPKLIIGDTRKMSRLYNKLATKNKNIIACLHLTC